MGRCLYCETTDRVITDVEDDLDSVKILRHLELIDDEASEYGVKIVKCSDTLMAKKYGYRHPPGLTYFRKTKPINYDGDIDDEEELLDWLTNPDNMEMTDQIERVNRKMFQKIRQNTDHLAVFFCKCDNGRPDLIHFHPPPIVTHFQTVTIVSNVQRSSLKSNTLTMKRIRRESSSSKYSISKCQKRWESLPCLRLSSLRWAQRSP